MTAQFPISQFPFPVDLRSIEEYKRIRGSQKSILDGAKIHFERIRIESTEIQKLLAGRSEFDEIREIYRTGSAKYNIESLRSRLRRIEYEKRVIEQFISRYHGAEECDAYFLREMEIVELNVSIIDAAGRLAESAFPSQYSVSQDEVDESDQALIQRWAQGETERPRLESARVAEKAAMKYLVRLGFSVEDVSVTQLDQSSSRWKDYDLLVNGVPVDVKNVRRIGDSERFMEHYVPRFKLERERGVEVRVLGVVSQRHPQNYSCTMLGWMSKSKFRLICDWINRRFGSEFKVASFSERKYVPGWMFEYPSAHYASKRPLRDCGDLFVSRAMALDVELTRLPKWLAPFSSEDNESIFVRCDEDRVVLRDLRAIKAELGYTRAALYLYTMGLTVTTMLHKKPADSVLRSVEAYIAHDGKLSMLEDPHRSIEYLISALRQVSAALRDCTVEEFHMSHPLILRARFAKGGWRTVMAYCGGYLEQERGRSACGRYPLLYGVERSCEECGKLICERCDFCDPSCSRIKMNSN